jgi:hypothetical protein
VLEQKNWIDFFHSGCYLNSYFKWKFLRVFQAYKHPRATAVQVAKIVAITVILSSAILGSCILASAWIQSRATCELLLMEQQLQQAQVRTDSLNAQSTLV